MRLPFSTTGLPVESILDQLSSALDQSGLAVLQAEPGAGKTSLVPPAMVNQTWLAGQKILMLQPRRVAARASAERIAELLGEPVGQTAGYRISLETRVGHSTRIEVLTEGILSRLIQDQPELPGVGLLIFDEFHERSQHADLGLAMALEVRESLRPDLRILVMSATIDAPALARLLGGGGTPAPMIDCPGRSFAVRAEWRPPQPGADGRAADYWQDSRRFLGLVAERIREGLAQTKQDILVFLPGQGEINRVAEALSGLDSQVEIVPLHGSLAAGQQAAVLRPGRLRRVVLATNVAETSLTIPGIGLVIDSGLVRVNRFDARLGMDRLVTERVSQASSLQRQGRAGRLAEGQCWKLWPQSERLEPFLPPETERADLADFVLASRAWGKRSPVELRLLSPPSTALWHQAESLLASLGALNDAGSLSGAGQTMAGLGLHPRTARLILAARQEGPASEGSAWACAALLGERDLLGTPDTADFQVRLDLLLTDQGNFNQNTNQFGINQAQLQRCRELWHRRAGQGVNFGTRLPTTAPGRLLALAWPDRIARLDQVDKDRQGRLVANYQLSSGRRAQLTGKDAQHPPVWLVALDAEAGEAITTIRLFALVDAPNGLENLVPELVIERLSIAWDGWRPRASRQKVLDQLVISDKPLPAGQVPRQALLDSWLAHIRPPEMAGQADALHALTMGLPWSETSLALLARLRWAQARQPDRWPDCRPTTLAAMIESWLLPHLRSSGGPVIDAEILGQALESYLGWAARSKLDSEVPTHWQVPSGSRRPLEYPTVTGTEVAGASTQALPAPILAVRIQEIFGLDRQPAILGLPVQLHLLSPGQKPLQVTSDLASFWTRTYPEIRKEMRGRYPRHYWPENPLEAEPTARAKPRGT